MIKSSLKIGGRTFHAEGATIKEAILNLKPSVNKGIAVLTLEKDTARRQIILPARAVAILFAKMIGSIRNKILEQVAVRFNVNLFE